MYSYTAVPLVRTFTIDNLIFIDKWFHMIPQCINVIIYSTQKCTRCGYVKSIYFPALVLKKVYNLPINNMLKRQHFIYSAESVQPNSQQIIIELTNHMIDVDHMT